jgi:hypothetical protein
MTRLTLYSILNDIHVGISNLTWYINCCDSQHIIHVTVTEFRYAGYFGGGMLDYLHCYYYQDEEKTWDI